MNLTELHSKDRELCDQLASEQKRHELTTQALQHELRTVRETIAREAVGLDHEKILLAEHVLAVSGKYGYGDDPSVVRDAIAALMAGGGKLREDYFGTKNYDRWSHQREDHTYGYGPRHGSMVFRVGIRDERRKRLAAEPLTPDEIEAAVYYLTCLPAIQAAKEKAVA